MSAIFCQILIKAEASSSVKFQSVCFQVFDYMNNLISFTELFGKNRVDEVEATGESSVWKRTINRVAYGGGMLLTGH